jgi:hypothetical protein
MNKGLAGYFTEIKGAQFDDAALTTEIQLTPFGTYQHPIHGELVFDDAKLQRFADNFNNNVRGTDIDIDYDHKAHHGKAAGWLRAVTVKAGQGLWGTVEWTKDAYRALKEGEYRYFSPEFADEWDHPSSGETFKDVLFGGGITNRPFIKDILPINLSELRFAEGGNPAMDPKLLRQRLGLPEDATDEAVTTALEALPEPIQELVKAPEAVEPPKDTEPPTPPVVEQEKVPATLAEPPADLVKLAETNPAVKLMLQEREANAKRLEALETSSRLSEVKLQIKTLSEGGKFAIPPVALDELQTVLLAAPVQLADSFVKVVQSIIEKGLVDLSEHGTVRPETVQLTDISAFTKAVDKIQLAEPTLSPVDALERAAAENPALYAAYRMATLAAAAEVNG